MAFENRFRPLVARRAMKKLREDPDDTAQAIVVIGALSGNSGKRAFERFSTPANAPSNVSVDLRVVSRSCARSVTCSRS